MNPKIRLAGYLQKRGYKLLPGTIIENKVGVAATLVVNEPTHTHFSSTQKLGPKRWYVMLRLTDYENEKITEGLF